MKCQVCSGEMKLKHIQHDLWVGKKLFVIQDVPADVCDLCGETVFNPKITDRILTTVKFSKKSKRRLMEVPVLTLKHAV